MVSKKGFLDVNIKIVTIEFKEPSKQSSSSFCIMSNGQANRSSPRK
jgi:hypothetical protein